MNSKLIKNLIINVSALLIVFGINCSILAQSDTPSYNTLIVSMGCFWCAESEFRDHESFKPLTGIIDLKVGYVSDKIDSSNIQPTYENHKGYIEAIKITYDAQKISYEQLLEIFWKNIDPFDGQGQFCDQGSSYIAAIFYKDDQEKALSSLRRIQQHFKKNRKFMGLEIKTKILPYANFFNAEEYHQNYKQKNPIRYQYYRYSCGRDQRIKEIWTD